MKLLGILSLFVVSSFGATPYTNITTDAVQYDPATLNIRPNGGNQIFNTLHATNINGGVLADDGTTTRLLSLRFAETVNVADRGAIGNGSADNTLVLSNAFLSASGKTVVFPAGDYMVSGYIPLVSN